MNTAYSLTQHDALVRNAKQRAAALRREALRHFGASTARGLRALWRQAARAWALRRAKPAAACPR
jgi:hypothetical protein